MPPIRLGAQGSWSAAGTFDVFLEVHESQTTHIQVCLVLDSGSEYLPSESEV